MTMAEALAQSINTIAVQVALRAGVGNIVAVAHRLGIASPLIRDPSIALGTDEVNLLELVSAYAPFANGGIGVWPHGIAEIRDSAGKVLYRPTGSGPGRVVSAELTGAMNRMLSGVIDHGTGRDAALPRPAAGKTGTTQDYRDAWFVGYTADLVAGVWFGNDDDRPMHKVTGGSLPARGLAPLHAGGDPRNAGPAIARARRRRRQVAVADAVDGRRRVVRQFLRSVPPPAGGSPASPTRAIPAQQRTLRGAAAFPPSRRGGG